MAIAKINGLSAMVLTMSAVTMPASETPAKTSAPFIASARVRAEVSIANSAFAGFMPSGRPL